MRLLALFCCPIIVLAQDFPQWRGLNRDGVVPGFREPAAWPPSLKRAWSVEVGVGHSSPVITGGKVYLHSRQQDEEVVAGYDQESGRQLWRSAYPAPYTVNSAARRHGPGPKSTPVLSGGKLCTLGISGILTCHDAASGKVLWRKDFQGQFDTTSPDFGTAMSPLVLNGRLIVHVGGNVRGALTAFAVSDGAVKWSWTGDGPGYASPIAATLAGVPQIVTQSRNHIIGVSASDGRLLWKFPFTTEYVQNIVTPLVYRDTLILSGINKGVFAVRVVKKGAAYEAEKVWENQDAALYMNSPVLHGDFVYGLSHKNRGQYFCLDARDGKLQWSTPGREGENAAILLAGNTLLLLNNDAALIVAKATSQAYTELQRYKVADSATWAHPALSNRGILIKDHSTLAFWRFE